MRKLIVVMLLAMVSGSVAAEWVKVGSVQRDGGADFYADPTTIRRSGDMVKMWAMTDFKTAKTSAGKRYLSARAQNEYDCKVAHTRILYDTLHSESMGNGNVVSVYEGLPLESWTFVSPGSVDEGLWKVACGKK